MKEAFICDYIRTPIGRFGGSLSNVRADDLGAMPIKSLVERNTSVDWTRLDDVFMGCANQAGEDNRNVARMSLLLAGLPSSVPGTTMNRLCGSGMDAVGTAARAIACGELDLVIAGGVESMTRAPFVMAKPEKAFARSAKLEDTTIGWRLINPKMKEAYGVDPLTETAENVADDYHVSREDQDAFALLSQKKAAAAQASGFFAEEIVPVVVPKGKAGSVTMSEDEHPRPDTTLEALAGLKPVVRPGGTVTAGNSSGVNDGAAALLLASAEAVKAYGLTPKARILGMATAGVPPRIMGIGPIYSTRRLLDRLGTKIEHYDFIELNEAFASQSLATLRDLGLPDDAAHVNPHGGAIALGHPLGMSGARLVLTLVHTLQKTGKRHGLAAMCIGVGQGVSLAVEAI